MFGTLNFLSIPAKYVLLLPAITIAWTILIGGPVTELPFGMQEPLEFFANQLAMIRDFMPWMEVIFQVFLIGVQVKLFMLTADIIFRVIGIFVQA